MIESTQVQESPVKTTADGALVTIELNRPHVLNSLNVAMICQIRASMENAKSNDACKCVLLRSSGGRAFCAGGDIKVLAQWVRQGDFASAEKFFEEEYALDLYLHVFSKPLLVIADGITMGGGLGLVAGADLVMATERSRMAMPETGIGFFPDVGATRWLFDKCTKGYPEFLALTGHEVKGADTVRCGLATHLLPSQSIEIFVEALKAFLKSFSGDTADSLAPIRSIVEQHSETPGPFQKRAVWVEKNFANKASIHDIVTSLKTGASQVPFCQEILKTLMNRSPTSLAMTYLLFGLNKKRSVKEVFRIEQKAAAFMIRHPDYLEGIRAQVLEKDHRPQWNPVTIEAVEEFGSVFG